MDSENSPTRLPFAEWSPWLKITVWLGALLVFSLLCQAFTWLVGWDFDILSHKGRSLLLAAALICFLTMMRAEGRPASLYGFVVAEDWKRQWFGGILLGIVTFGTYYLLAISAGSVQLAAVPEIEEVGKGLLSGLTSFPVAIIQQIIVSGYLLWLFKQKLPTFAAVGGVSLLFAGMHELGNPNAFQDFHQCSLFMGLFLVAMFLATLRLYTGTLLLPAGILAGWLFVRRIGRKIPLFEIPETPVYEWIAPLGDPRLSPFLWSFLILGTAWLTWKMAHRETIEPTTAAPPISGNFKKVFPLTGMQLQAPLDVWLRELIRNRFAIGSAYLPRLAFSLVASTINTILSLPERFILPWLVKNQEVAPPLFVVGIHRSGTTHLHNLLSLDKRFVAPMTFQVFNPVGFLISGWLVQPVLAAFSPWKRPMDNVKIGPFHPQEEEFALSNQCGLSPYWGMTFPQNREHYDQYIFVDQLSEKDQETWKKQLHFFLQKVCWQYPNRRLLLKNPYNTARVGLLSELYSGAKFVHIHRHPEDVYRSNAHLARECHVVTQVQDQPESENYTTRFVNSFVEIESAFERDAAQLPREDVIEIAYEELDQHPKEVIEAIYDHLQIPMTEQMQTALDDYLASLEGYQKNKHRPMAPKTQSLLWNRWRHFYEKWGYRPRTQPTSSASEEQATSEKGEEVISAAAEKTTDSPQRKAG
ncbi:Hypothetical protein PBC10988_37420 [Planctomycetales bacterium 10988]|nr:Hypothetical protein PBC10988_37420 [Planctomycetales bacterium 10988]